MLTIGVFGGTFNPPTCSHEQIAELAWRELRLGRLLFVPNRRPVHKSLADGPGAKARAQMCQALCADHPGWEVLDWELERAGPSYMTETLRALAEQHSEARRWLILGSDAALDLPNWYQPAELIMLADIAVVPRYGYPALDAAALQTRLPGLHLRVLSAATASVSSTQVRAALAGGGDTAGLLPPAVAALIAAGGWYRSPQAA